MTVITAISFKLCPSQKWVPQGSVFGPLLFLLYKNELPKIINETSAPIIFADDTSILFAHSNLRDLEEKKNHSQSLWNFK